jgi:hypothetical protein
VGVAHMVAIQVDTHGCCELWDTWELASCRTLDRLRPRARSNLRPLLRT